MSKRAKNQITTFVLMITIIGVASSFCFLNLNSASAMESMNVMDMGTYHSQADSLISIDYNAGHTNLLCCQENNNNQNISIFSDNSIKISKLSVSLNSENRENFYDSDQSSKIFLASNNSPPGDELLTISKKE